MAIDQKEAQKYIDGILKTLEETGGEGLSDTEIRLGNKCKQGNHRLQQVLSDISSLRDQITQATARMKSLELQAEGEQGRINGFVEILVEEHFGEELGGETPVPKPKPKPKAKKTAKTNSKAAGESAAASA